MIDSGVKTFVRVKRRMAKDKVESVKEIRDLLGAAIVKMSDHVRLFRRQTIILRRHRNLQIRWSKSESLTDLT